MTLLGSSILRMTAACLLLVGAAASPAQSVHLDKHARKIHHRLARFESGHYLHLVLRNDSNDYGALGALYKTSFTFTSADNNRTSTYAYDDVARVRTDKEPIGAGSEPHHHIRHLVPIVIAVAALGTAGAVYAVER